MDIRGHRRTALAVTATVALLLPLGWYWKASLLPSTYSVMDMGYADYGGGSWTSPAQTDHDDIPGMSYPSGAGAAGAGHAGQRVGA